MSVMLGISKAIASVGTRQMAWGEPFAKSGFSANRRDYYEVVEDFAQLIRRSIAICIRPRIQSSKDRLAILKVNLNKDIQSGAITLEKKDIFEKRIKVIGENSQTPFPIPAQAEKFIN